MEIEKIKLYNPIIPVCHECNQQQFSLMDRKYLEIYNRCWSCDKKDWEAGFLSLEDFERKEKEALRLSLIDE